MKALTIWQPWASLIAAGEKIYETRSWPTKYRGPIAIHAAKKDPAKAAIWTPELDKYAWNNEKIGPAIFLPTGCVIAIGELVNVWHIVHHPGLDVDKAKHINIGAESLTEDKHAPGFGDYFVLSEKEMALGDWTPGRYAWEIRNVQILEIAPAVKGQQGIWNWDENEPRVPGWKYYGPGQWVKASTDPFGGEKYFLNGGITMNVREKTASEKRLIDYYYLAEKIECPGQPLVYWDDIEAAPTVDAVEVTRCRECKYHKDTNVTGFVRCCLYGLIMRYNDFCSYGKREGGYDND